MSEPRRAAPGWGHRGAVEMLSHQLERLVAPGGRLLVSNYVPAEQRDRHPAVALDRLGFRVAGVTAPGDSGGRGTPDRVGAVARSRVLTRASTGLRVA